MDPALTLILEKAAGQGLTVLLLVVAVYLVGQQMTKTLEGRLSDLKDHIDHLEKRAQQCEHDRAELWKVITKLNQPST